MSSDERLGPAGSVTSPSVPTEIGARTEAALTAISGQPETLHRIADVFAGEDRQTLASVRNWFWRGEHHLIVFTGTGSSLYAAQAVVPSLNRIGVRAVALDAGELLLHGVPTLAGKVAVVIVSRSGESEEARALVKALKGRVSVLGIVCGEASYLAAMADLVVRVPVPAEGPVALGSYTATIAVLLLLAHVVAGGVVERAASRLHAAAGGVSRVVEGWSEMGSVLATTISRSSLVYLLGSGSSLASALEGALLVQRLAGRPAVGLAPGQFRGGAIDALGQGEVILLAPQGPALEVMQRLAETLVTTPAGVTIISNARPSVFARTARLLPVQYPDDEFAPLVEIIPLQLAAWQLGQELRPLPSRASGGE